MTAQLLPTDSMTGDTALFGIAEHGDTDAPQTERATSSTQTEVKRKKKWTSALANTLMCACGLPNFLLLQDKPRYKL